MDDDQSSRRELLRAATRIAGTAAGVQFFTSWLAAGQGHQHSSSDAWSDAIDLQNYQPQFFSEQDFAALRAFTEILIPTDETPGAREAYCAHFIDFVLAAMNGHTPQTQAEWRMALAYLKKAGFYEAGPEQRIALVKEMSEPERNPSLQHPGFTAYRLIKRENTFAFYTSHTGCIQTLDYRGNTYNLAFPACTHPEHHRV